MAIPAIVGYALPTAAELPQRRVAWRPDPARATLLVHDMQRYFTGRFADPRPLDRVVANIARLRRACAAAGVPVVYTAQPGGQEPARRGLLTDFWGPGLPADPVAESMVDELTPAAGDTVVVKHRYSAFTGTNLAEVLGGRDQLVIVGVYAHIGVQATACDAFMRDIQPFVVADAVADFSAAHQLDSLRYVAGRCGVVAPTDDIVAELTTRSMVDSAASGARA